jgi:D-serine deaminase-like pyridoxal phosphate-dependent protein
MRLDTMENNRALYNLQQLETPAVLLDAAILASNLSSMQKRADRHGVALRPHIKTHKSLEIGRRQIALGATGITVATLDEAITFLEGGFKSVTIARPMVTASKWDRLFSVLRRCNAEIRGVVDSEEGIQILSDRAVAANQKVGVFLKIDVGLHRCGLQPEDTRIPTLAQMLHTQVNLDFCGILSHAGHAYAAGSMDVAANLAEQERLLMLGVRDRLITRRILVPEVSVGATPSVLATTNFEGITEIRPGNYVFLDLLPVRAGVAQSSDIALSVLGTVISKNKDYFITDAGSKTLTSDTGVHGMTGTQGFGLAYPLLHYQSSEYALVVEKVSEEHGLMRRTNFDLPIGSQVRINPIHACPVANLAREYVVVGEEALRTWPVDAATGSR